MPSEKKHIEEEVDLTEERINQITHGIACLLSVFGTFLLVKGAVDQDSVLKIISFSVYGMSMVILFLASTLYHSFHYGELNKKLKIFDHAAIYILIAGTYTPFTLVLIKGTFGWILFGVIWTMAIAGVIFKLFFVHRFKFVSTMLYVVMGWMAVIAMNPILEGLTTEGVFWLFFGGFCYTGGVVFYLWKKLRFNHAIWHFFVMGGAFGHFWCAFNHLLEM